MMGIIFFPTCREISPARKAALVMYPQLIRATPALCFGNACGLQHEFGNIPEENVLCLLDFVRLGGSRVLAEILLQYNDGWNLKGI